MLSPVPVASLLVVAPDADLRQSLVFVLQASGFAVHSCTTWPPDNPLEPFDAIILDEIAVPRGSYADIRLAAFRDRIILLAGRGGQVPNIPHAWLVRKPLLDSLLLDLIQSLVATGSNASK